MAGETVNPPRVAKASEKRQFADKITPIVEKWLDELNTRASGIKSLTKSDMMAEIHFGQNAVNFLNALDQLSKG